MDRGFLVLDIETVPDAALYTPPPAPVAHEKPFPPLYAHRPIVLGVLWLDESYGFKRLGVVGEGKDEALLWDISSRYGEREARRWIAAAMGEPDRTVLKLVPETLLSWDYGKTA